MHADRHGAAVAVVTVTYNAGEVIEDFIRCMLSQTVTDWRLFVVDNASSDDTLQKLARIATDERIQIIPLERNTGAAAGNNVGLARALGVGAPHVLMTNNDVIFGPTVLNELLAAKSALPAGALSATLFYEEPSGALWYGGGRIQTRMAVRCIHEQLAPAARLARPRLYETHYAPTTFLLLNAKVIMLTGQLDEDYFAYWEDADYLWRLRQRGFKIWVARDVHVIHKIGQASGGSGSPYSNRQYYKNQILFSIKHFSIGKTVVTSLASMLRIFVRLFLRKDSFSLAKSKLMGLSEGWVVSRDRPAHALGWDDLPLARAGVKAGAIE